MKYTEEETIKLRNKIGEFKRELNYDLEEKEKTNVSLKEQLDEAKNTKKLMNLKLVKNIEDYEELKLNFIS